VVVVDDVAFGRLLQREADRRNCVTGWLVPEGPLGIALRAMAARAHLVQSFDGARRRASVVRRFLVRKAVLAWKRRARPLRLAELRRADIVVAVWGRADTFPQAGLLAEDRYLGRVPALLREAGFAVAYLGFPLTYVSRFGAIAANALAAQDAVVLIEDLIPWWAIIPAALSDLTFPSQVGQLTVLGIDATAVLRMEARRDRRLSVAVEARLVAYVGRGMERFGIAPKVVLHAYEAQPWEKMLALGIRRALPGACIVAMQHAPFAWNYLSFFPSRRSIAQGAVPDMLLATGAGYARWFAQAGIPSDRIAVLGAVRFDDIGRTDTPRGQAILCCTSIELDEAMELATKAAVATIGLGVRLTVNFHPVTDAAFRDSVRATVREATGPASDHVTFSEASVRDLLAQARDVLYMSSAVCFEAVSAGRRAIYVKRNLALDYDKLPGDIAMRCDTPETLRDMLIDLGTTARQSAGLLEWLAPVIAAPELRDLLTGGAAARQSADGGRPRAPALAGVGAIP
jgi:hypothetical protein